MIARSRPRLVGPGLLVALVILMLAPLVLRDFQQGLLTEIFAFALLAMAFDILYGYTGMLSFGQALYFGTGAIIAGILVERYKLGFLLVLLLATAIAALLAFATGFFAVRVGGHNFVIITVIFSLVFYFLALQWRAFTGGDDGMAFHFPPVQVAGLSLDLSNRHVVYYTVLGLGTLVFLLCKALVTSPLGLVFRTIRENELRSALIGYNVRRYKLLAFVIAGAVSGLGGVLFALSYRFASVALLYWTVSGDAVIWTLFGGAGTLVGPILGTGILMMLSDYLSTWFQSHQIILGIVIIVTVLVVPQGLVGLFRGRWLARRRT